MIKLDIAEVAQRSGIPASTLRFYEEKGLIASTGRRGLRRLFDMDVLDPAFAPGVWHREPGECWCERRSRIYLRLRERS